MFLCLVTNISHGSQAAATPHFFWVFHLIFTANTLAMAQMKPWGIYWSPRIKVIEAA